MNQTQNICSTQSFSTLLSLNFISKKLNLPKNLFLYQKTFKNYSINCDNETNNLLSLTSDDPIDAITLIKKIVEFHNKNNLNFILPWEDSEAMNSIELPFKFLLEQG